MAADIALIFQEDPEVLPGQAVISTWAYITSASQRCSKHVPGPLFPWPFLVNKEEALFLFQGILGRIWQIEKGTDLSHKRNLHSYKMISYITLKGEFLRPKK